MLGAILILTFYYGLYISLSVPNWLLNAFPASTHQTLLLESVLVTIFIEILIKYTLPENTFINLIQIVHHIVNKLVISGNMYDFHMFHCVDHNVTVLTTTARQLSLNQIVLIMSSIQIQFSSNLLQLMYFPARRFWVWNCVLQGLKTQNVSHNYLWPIDFKFIPCI